MTDIVNLAACAALVWGISSCQQRTANTEKVCMDGSKPGTDGRCQQPAQDPRSAFADPSSTPTPTPTAGATVGPVTTTGGNPTATPTATTTAGGNPTIVTAPPTVASATPTVGGNGLGVAIPPLSPDGRTVYLTVHPVNPKGLVAAAFGGPVQNIELRYESVRFTQKQQDTKMLSLDVSMSWHVGNQVCVLPVTTVGQDGGVFMGRCE